MNYYKQQIDIAMEVNFWLHHLLKLMLLKHNRLPKERLSLVCPDLTI